MSKDNDKNIKKSKTAKSEDFDIPVNIGGEEIRTDRDVILKINLGKEDKKINEAIKKSIIQKSEDSK